MAQASSHRPEGTNHVVGPTLSALLGGPRLAAGILGADLMRLGDDLRLLEAGGTEVVHIDVGDGVFSPLFTIGPPIVKAMRTSLIKDVHLMVDDPLAKIEGFVEAGADMITFQLERVHQPHRVLQAIGQATNVNDPQRGIVRGVALAPSTPLGALEPLIDELDYVLILAINPGWTGQSFLASTAQRIQRAREARVGQHPPVRIADQRGRMADEGDGALGLRRDGNRRRPEQRRAARR